MDELSEFFHSECHRGLLENSMDEYKAFVFGPDDHIIHRVDLICIDEKAARECAAQLADGHAVELWQSDRMLERFEPPQISAGNQIVPE
jgi:hypothetical protein